MVNNGVGGVTKPDGKYSSGLIILTGYSTPGPLNDAIPMVLKPFMPSDVRMVCPSPPKRRDPIPLPVNMWNGNNWFDMITNDGLPEAMALVDGYIKDMEAHGIPSHRVVLMGMSQGGAVTLYYALNTRYKLL